MTENVELPDFYTNLKEKDVEKEVRDITDIFMRILAGREMVVAFNVCLSTLNTITQTLPESEKLFVAETLCDLAESFTKSINDKDLTNDIKLQ